MLKDEFDSFKKNDVFVSKFMLKFSNKSGKILFCLF